MKFFDTHVHYLYDDSETILRQIRESEYKNVYLGYSDINLENSSLIEHLNLCSGAFVMPFCLKETNIFVANNSLNIMAKITKNSNVHFLPFIDPNEKDYERFEKIIGLKEHFYLHDSFKYEERKNSYKYLNRNGGLLLLHCDNGIRINYVKYLATTYPNMFIQIAHLGVFRNCLEASMLVIKELSNLENVYFDVSTVFDCHLIKYALLHAENKVMFGTDVPYIRHEDYMAKYYALLEDCNLSDQLMDKLLMKNAMNLESRLFNNK